MLKYFYKGEQNMTGKTHASCGFLVGAITTQYFHTDIFTSISVIVLSVISSILPDICHTQSKIGRRFRLTSFFRILFGHRTFTHSLLFIIGISFYCTSYKLRCIIWLQLLLVCFRMLYLIY